MHVLVIMPSRKKAKGKARKAAKEAKAKAEEEESEAVTALGTQLQQLRINAASQELCSHGLVQSSAGEEKIIVDFINAFIAKFRSVKHDVGAALVTAQEATIVEYVDVYSSKLDTVISILLSYGTKCILDGGNRQAQEYAAFACYLENLMAVDLHKTKATAGWAKIIELYVADDHTLVSFYRKRIPCSCLDEKYKEVKSVKKMGLCDNLDCNLPDRMVERRKMFSCTRCGDTNYCSVECQRADWKTHRVRCNKIVEMKAAFNSNQT